MKKRLSLVMLMSFALFDYAYAQNAYISDQLEVPIRAGASNRYKIHKMLTSGEPVQILEENTRDGYSRVRAGSLEGWVLTRYLMDEPSARNYIKEAKEQFSQLDQIKAELENAKNKEKEYLTKIENLELENQSRIDELVKIKQISADAMLIDERNQELEKKVTDLSNKLSTTETLNIELKASNNKNSWYTGAIIAAAGLFLGLILANSRSKPKRPRYY